MHAGDLGVEAQPIPGGVWGLVRQGNPWGGAGGYWRVVTAWPALPEAIKAGILAMVRGASGSEE